MTSALPIAALAGLALLAAPLGAGPLTGPDEPADNPAVSDHPETLESPLGASQAPREEVIATTDGPPDPVADRAAGLGAEIVWTYDLIDGFAANVPADDVGELERLPGVESVSPSAEVRPLLNNSVKDVRATSAWNESVTGSNVSVAILDTGIERTDPAFSGAVSACVSTSDGVVLPECSDTHGHGTHVSGIAASRDDTYRGVAHGADVAAVRVLRASASDLGHSRAAQGAGAIDAGAAVELAAEGVPEHLPGLAGQTAYAPLEGPVRTLSPTAQGPG